MTPREAILTGRRVGLGVGGSIAAYKALGLASRLTAMGTDVDAILTPAAAEIVRPLAFQAITHRPAVTDLWDPQGRMGLDHLEIAQGIEGLLVAPATANLLAELALGLAPDALTTTALAFDGPLLVAPAMEPNMWSHPATRQHVETLKDRGAVLIGPETGRLASGRSGPGRLAGEDQILAALARAIGPRDLKGLRLLVTAGPSAEEIDPVRYLSNHSTGAMGFTLAEAAWLRGAEVVLIAGPVARPTPPGVERHDVVAAKDMLNAVIDRLDAIDVLIMSAAVADFRPRRRASHKVKKADGMDQLDLVPTEDILMAVQERLRHVDSRPVIVGFAAETDDVPQAADRKRRSKGADLIVGNRVPAAFGDGPVEAWLVNGEGATRFEGDRKPDLATTILDWVASAIFKA